MDDRSISLSRVFEGWEGYNTSLARAIAPRTPEELAWRSMPAWRTVGETAAHISLGRIDWFHRMGAPRSEPLHDLVVAGEQPDPEDAADLARWLGDSWRMVEATLGDWTVADLFTTFRQPYQGKVYAVSRQWVLWRILSHDIQHGGQNSVMLGQQGVELPELTYLGGHLTEPPLAEDT